MSSDGEFLRNGDEKMDSGMLTTRGYEAFHERSCIKSDFSSTYYTLGLVEEASPCATRGKGLLRDQTVTAARSRAKEVGEDHAGRLERAEGRCAAEIAWLHPRAEHALPAAAMRDFVTTVLDERGGGEAGARWPMARKAGSGYVEPNKMQDAAHATLRKAV